MQARNASWFRRFLKRVRQELRWLMPGIGVKRWLAVLLVGTTFNGVGLAMLLLDIYRNVPESRWLPVISAVSLQSFARPVRVFVFLGLGIAVSLWGVWGLNRSLLRPFVRPGRHVLDTVTDYRKRERGPKIVVIGGGTGLASLLRGIKHYSHNITAIVTVADDGGSSGELRRNMGVLPPGDIRNCLAALSDDEELVTQLFKYRFGASAGLNGHNLGNLLITAMADITGSFERGIAESGRVLAVRGRVMPSTLNDVKLVADIRMPELNQEIRVSGESKIPTTPGKINRVWLEPNNLDAYPPAIQAILNADLIIVGPGSLYTSLLPNLLVPDIAAAIQASRAYKFYICNVATQPGETDHFSCFDHIQSIERHVGGRLFDLVICNNARKEDLPGNVNYVLPDERLEEHYPMYCADLLDDEQPWRHDSDKLARVVMDLYSERTGPLYKPDDDLVL